MSDEQVLEHLKEVFLSKIDAKPLEIDDTDTVIGKTRGLVLLFKLELPQFASSSMLTHMTDRNENVNSTEQCSKPKPVLKLFVRMESIQRVNTDHNKAITKHNNCKNKIHSNSLEVHLQVDKIITLGGSKEVEYPNMHQMADD